MIFKRRCLQIKRNWIDAKSNQVSPRNVQEGRRAAAVKKNKPLSRGRILTPPASRSGIQLEKRQGMEVLLKSDFSVPWK